jgi:hypothetical protein
MGQVYFLAIITKKIQEFLIIIFFLNSPHQKIFIFINFTHFP